MIYFRNHVVYKWSAAASFSEEEDKVVFVEYDGSLSHNKFVLPVYEVKSFPQIRFHPKDSTGFEFFNDVMSSEAMVAFVNARIGTNRTSGLVVAVNNVILDAAKTGVFDENFLNLVTTKTEEHPNHPYMATYVKLAQKVVEEGINFVHREIIRLDALIDNESVGFQKKREIIARRHMLDLFLTRPNMEVSISAN